MGLRKILVSLCIGVGAVGLGAAASAAVDGMGDESTTTTTTVLAADDSPTTTEAPPSTEVPTTVPPTTAPPVTEAPTTVPPTTAPPVTEAPTEAAQAANLYGQCTAFAGREQPGNSRAWERLNEQAGGDLEAFCAEVLGAPRADDGGEPSEEVEDPDDGAEDAEADRPEPGSKAPDHAGSRGGKG